MTSRFTANLNASVDNALSLFSVSNPLNQVIAQIFTNGTGENQANRLYADSITTTGAGYNLNCYNFGGVKDALGQTYALTAVRLLLIQNLNQNNLIVSISGGLGNAWTYLFGGTLDGAIRVSAGGVMILTGPANVGYSVNSGMNTVNIADEFSGSTSFNVIVFGCQ